MKEEKYDKVVYYKEDKMRKLVKLISEWEALHGLFESLIVSLQEDFECKFLCLSDLPDR